MNNYLYANLTNGKLSRGQGAGIPVFTIGENNPTQIYFIDYDKPASYNASIPPLGDPYTYTPNPINKNSSTLTVRVGPRIDQQILTQSSWSNLPTAITPTFSANISSAPFAFDGNGNVRQSITVLSGQFSTNQIPVSGSALCSLNITFIRGYSCRIVNFEQVCEPLYSSYTQNFTVPYYFSGYEVTQLADAFAGAIGLRTDYFINARSTDPDPFLSKSVYPISDSGYAFEYRGSSFFQIFTQSTSLSSSFLAASGKFANLDFSSPAWTTLLGNDDEKEIWVDVILDGRIVSQGSALLRNKLST